MRAAGLLPFLLLACCATIPRVDDRTEPRAAFETFRSAVARKEYEREWGCLSDRLRQGLGVGSRSEWADARNIVLTQDHRLIRGILRAKVDGESAPEADGRVVLQLDFPLGYRGRVWMAPVAVLRVYVKGRATPFYEHLHRLDVVVATDAAGVRVPPDVTATMREELLGREVEAFVARIEWFVDDFAAGKDTPQSIRSDMDEVQ